MMGKGFRFQRVLSMALAVMLLLACFPAGVLTAQAEQADTLEGKTISILGASISTYAGTSNGEAADTTNSTIRDNAKYYPNATVDDVTLNDTWWMQAAEDLGLRLLVNNSWSGSSLLHERSGTVGAYVDRCVQLHDDTGDNAGEMPDLIAIQLGTNDFQYYKDTLGTANIDYAALITENGDGSYTYATPVTSLEAAAIVLHKISVRYPGAEVYFLNISQRIDGTDDLIQSFNAELKQVVEHFGAHIVDIYGSAITMTDFDTYIGDNRVHPNKLGMDAYTEAFKAAVLANTAYDVTAHTVSLELDGVTADYGDDKLVVDGDSFTVNLAAADMLEVTVIMGGQDVTADTFANGKVTIGSVTADVTITAQSVHTPKDYRWEFDGSELACVSGDNTLTKNAGTTTDGVFSKTRYALQTDVILQHDLPWSVEWKCEGTFLNANGSSGARIFTSDDVNANYNARYVFKSNTNGLIAMGEKTTTGSHNYGIALGDHDIDWTALHTYRLENRIADDGSNMIWLFVDGGEIGPMNGYYVGTKDQQTTSNWLSGKDFVFPYMGTNTHGFTNASIDYIQVTECVHNFEKGVCTACGTEKQEPIWEVGTIAAANGQNSSNTTRLRTVDYLVLSDYNAVTLNHGYTITYFAYDANRTYLGNGSSDLTGNWLGSGVGITGAEILSLYENAVYFRLALRSTDSSVMSLDAVADSGICFYHTGEEIPEKESDLTQKTVMNVGGWQDGAIWDGKLFALGGSGTGAVYDLSALTKLGTLTLDQAEILKPHANAVCFGSTYYAEGDTYPLLYVNVYNNYASADDRMEGTCCVYRVTEADGAFATELVQVIRIGFVEELSLWKSKENNGDVRPYGNFAVDTDNGKIYAFVMRDANKTTRFFRFALPALTEGTYNETYGCNVVTLESSDIEEQFDTAYFHYLQGCTYYDGKIVSVEGFHAGGSAEPALRVIDLAAGRVTDTYYLAEAALTKEPEIVCADPVDGTLYYAAADGVLRILSLPSWHTHTYTPAVTAPTCTEAGCTTYTCTLCGDSYIDSYTDPRPLNILMIGNSFSWDAADFWYDMQESMTYNAMKSMLAESYDIHFAVMYKGSATLAYHATCAMKNTRNYTYTEIGPETDYVWTPSDGQNATNGILERLEQREWDIIVIQSYQHEADGTEPRSTYTGGDAQFEKPDASLGYLLDYFNQYEPGAQVYYYMPWATTRFYNTSGVEAGFKAIAEYSENHIVHMTGTNSGKELAGIIPVGTGIQNARTTYLDELRYSSGTGSTTLLQDPQIGLQYDNQHLSFGIGRYIAGIIVAESLIPKEMRKDDYSWPAIKDSPAVGAMPDEYTQIAQKAAVAAMEMPYAITALSGYERELADRVCDAIETADYSAGGITDETALRNYVETVVAEKLKKMGNAEAAVSIHSFDLKDGKIVAMEASVALRIGYNSSTAEISVTDGKAHHFGDWECLSIPSAAGPGLERRVCETCGFVDERIVEGSWQKYALADHLQELPEEFCSETNLWNLLEPETVMIDHLGNWVSAGATVYSVTIPVDPGEKIYANSFDQTDSRKGIQVSFIGDYGIVKTTFSSGTYEEFHANGGYLLAPEGTIAVNIPVWNVNDEANTIHILGYDHVYESMITAPTCTEAGYTTYTCTLCGGSYVDSEVAPLGHTPKEAVKENETASGYDLVVYCGICGGELSREHVVVYMPGDINGDGKVNNKDATRLFQYLSGWNVTVVEAALDVNGDGKVNNKDATRLFQHLSGWNVEIY